MAISFSCRTSGGPYRAVRCTSIYQCVEAGEAEIDMGRPQRRTRKSLNRHRRGVGALPEADLFRCVVLRTCHSASAGGPPPSSVAAPGAGHSRSSEAPRVAGPGSAVEADASAPTDRATPISSVWHGPYCRFTLCLFRRRAARRRCRTRLPTPRALPRLAWCWGRCCGRF
jgi:hypothetical protein